MFDSRKKTSRWYLLLMFFVVVGLIVVHNGYLNSGPSKHVVASFHMVHRSGASYPIPGYFFVFKNKGLTFTFSSAYSQSRTRCLKKEKTHGGNTWRWTYVIVWTSFLLRCQMKTARICYCSLAKPVPWFRPFDIGNSEQWPLFVNWKRCLQHCHLTYLQSNAFVVPS